MDIDSALEKIYSLKQFHVKLGLDNITALLNHIGNPHRELKAIHVAGSNGKGSTCSFIASVLQENGYTVGLYTSPHFVRFNERIRINGIEIPDSEIISFLELNRDYLDRYQPTFFEIATALAFSYFKNEKVDIAVIETGLGGRLDATNVIIPIASVITSLSLEHSHILGNTISDIAFEKAGIIKRNVPVFIAEMEKSAEDRIINIARERGAPLYLLNRFWNKVKREINVNGRSFCIKRTGLKGSHQMENAALALITLFSVTDLHDDKKIVMGLDNVVNNSGIQGRYEFIGPFRNIIFDAAHNLDGVKICLQEFKREYKKYQNRTLIFGAKKDKDIAKMLELLNPYFDRIIITSVNNERAASVSEITVIAENSGIRTENGLELKKIIVDHFKERPEDCLTVLGSIYLLGEIKKTILSQI